MVQVARTVNPQICIGLFSGNLSLHPFLLRTLFTRYSYFSLFEHNNSLMIGHDRYSFTIIARSLSPVWELDVVIG
jgi:hypothetical protein